MNDLKKCTQCTREIKCIQVKGLSSKLSRLQSRAYNLQVAIQDLIGELESEKENE